MCPIYRITYAVNMAKGIIHTGIIQNSTQGFGKKQRLNHEVKASLLRTKGLLLDIACHSVQLFHLIYSSQCSFVLPLDTMSLIETWPLSPNYAHNGKSGNDSIQDFAFGGTST